MIDWVSFSLPYAGPAVGVQYLKSERRHDPVARLWQEVTEPAFNRPVSLEGSYSSKLQVQALGGRLYVSGNPVKWLTGQNVCGTNDLQRLLRVTLDEVGRRLDLWHCPLMWGSFFNGDVNLTRVDCTFSYSVGSDEEVVSWLAAMELACNVRFRGRGHFDQGMCSLMFGLSLKEGAAPSASRRSTFKFYNKFREMSVHPPTCDGSISKRLQAKVKGTVRGEACYRGIELKTLERDKLHQWTTETSLELHRKWVTRMEVAESYTIKSETEVKLPRKLQATYHLWRSGVDVRSLLSKSVFYVHRRGLMEHGIDISSALETPKEGRDPVRVIPVLRVLEAVPMAEDEDEAEFWRMAA